MKGNGTKCVFVMEHMGLRSGSVIRDLGLPSRLEISKPLHIVWGHVCTQDLAGQHMSEESI